MSACSSNSSIDQPIIEGYPNNSEPSRPYINLKDYLPRVEEELIQSKLEEYRITKLALDNIYSYLGARLGNSDKELGKKLFIELVDSEEVWVERIGKDKHGKDKFYIILDETEGEGGNNKLHLGFSRKGTPRAITEKKEGVNNFDSINLIQEFNEAIKEDSLRFAISKSKGIEESLKVSELGGENLSRLKINKLSQKERFQIYKSLLAGLTCMHSHGFVHRDLKPNNVVVIRNNKGEVIGAKIIDFDTLKKCDVRAYAEVTHQYYRSFGVLKVGMVYRDLFQRRITTHPGDDLWAVMISICELEKKVDKEKRFISNEFLEKFSEYQTAWNPTNHPDKQLRYANQYLFLSSLTSNLFDGIECNSILDPLIFEMACKDARKTDSMSAQELFNWMCKIEKEISG